MNEQNPPLNTKECDGPGCPGWGVFDDGQIQRCDCCERFNDDDEAVAYVKALEAVDVGRHMDAAAVRALDEVRNELSAVIEEISTNPKVEARKLMERLETLLGRSVWLQRHRWAEHGLQFARLLSELYALGDEAEDTDTIEPKPHGYFTVKIEELCESMNLSWLEVKSIFERANTVFENGKPEKPHG